MKTKKIETVRLSDWDGCLEWRPPETVEICSHEKSKKECERLLDLEINIFRMKCKIQNFCVESAMTALACLNTTIYNFIENYKEDVLDGNDSDYDENYFGFKSPVDFLRVEKDQAYREGIIDCREHILKEIQQEADSAMNRFWREEK